MAQITQITFKRHVNCGNFESFEIEATMTLAAEDVPGPEAERLQTFVDILCHERLDRGKRGKRGGMDAGELLDDLP